MNPHLFVYGTLMSTWTGGFGRTKRDRLRRDSRLVGPATVRGRLYDLGQYPGMIDSAEASDIVWGEVVALADPAHALRWLDDYEGIDPRGPERSDYERCERTVTLEGSGAPVIAWIYLWRRPISGATRIVDGRWRPSL